MKVQHYPISKSHPSPKLSRQSCLTYKTQGIPLAQNNRDWSEQLKFQVRNAIFDDLATYFGIVDAAEHHLGFQLTSWETSLDQFVDTLIKLSNCISLKKTPFDDPTIDFSQEECTSESDYGTLNTLKMLGIALLKRFSQISSIDSHSLHWELLDRKGKLTAESQKFLVVLKRTVVVFANCRMKSGRLLALQGQESANENLLLSLFLGCVGLAVRWQGESINVSVWVPNLLRLLLGEDDQPQQNACRDPPVTPCRPLQRHSSSQSDLMAKSFISCPSNLQLRQKLGSSVNNDRACPPVRNLKGELLYTGTLRHTSQLAKQWNWGNTGPFSKCTARKKQRQEFQSPPPTQSPLRICIPPAIIEKQPPLAKFDKRSRRAARPTRELKVRKEPRGSEISLADICVGPKPKTDCRKAKMAPLGHSIKIRYPAESAPIEAGCPSNIKTMNSPVGILKPLQFHILRLAKQYANALSNGATSIEIEKVKATLKKAVDFLQQAPTSVIKYNAAIESTLSKISQTASAGSGTLRFVIGLVHYGCWSGVYVTEFLMNILKFL